MKIIIALISEQHCLGKEYEYKSKDWYKAVDELNINIAPDVIFQSQMFSHNCLKIGQDVVIRSGCVIRQGSIIQKGSIIGENCIISSIIEPHCIIGGGSTICDTVKQGNKIEPNSFICRPKHIEGVIEVDLEQLERLAKPIRERFRGYIDAFNESIKPKIDMKQFYGMSYSHPPKTEAKKEPEPHKVVSNVFDEVIYFIQIKNLSDKPQEKVLMFDNYYKDRPELKYSIMGENKIHAYDYALLEKNNGKALISNINLRRESKDASKVIAQLSEIMQLQYKSSNGDYAGKNLSKNPGIVIRKFETCYIGEINIVYEFELNVKANIEIACVYPDVTLEFMCKTSKMINTGETFIK